jgi:hypothetical protein
MSRPLSNLEYNEGWISAITTGERLFKVPQGLAVRLWVAYGAHIALGIDLDRIVIINCERLLRPSDE